MQNTTPTLKELQEKYSELLEFGPKLTDALAQMPISKLSAEDSPERDSIVFLTDLKQLNSVIEAKPKAIVVLQKMGAQATILVPDNIALLLSPNPKLAMAIINKDLWAYNRILAHFTFSESKIHPTAVVHPTAQVAKDVSIGPFTVIGPNTKIASRCLIASHVTIEADCEIGEESQIFSNATIAWKTQMGKGCVVQSNSCIGSDGFGYATDQMGRHFGISHQGGVILKDYVHIGAGTQIDRGTYGHTVIGEQTKIDNLVHIAHNCKIGRSCFLTAGFMMAGSSEIGDFFVTGGGTVVTGHIKVANNVQVAGVSVIHKNVDKPGSYGGYPLVPLKTHLKNLSTYGKIVEIRKDLDFILKKLGLKNTEAKKDL